MKTLFFGGLLPVIAFTVIEEWKGPVWGTVAGLVFGAGEIIYEWRRDGKVSAITWTSNAFVFVLGLVSIWTQEGVWFKLQPALLVAVLGLWFIMTSFRGTPLLVALSQKQNPNLPPMLLQFFGKLNLRLGIFLLGLAALSAHAAFFWSTAAWAALKGIGGPILMGIYLVIEVIVFRLRMKDQGPGPL
jgi:intracellular septation protein